MSLNNTPVGYMVKKSIRRVKQMKNVGKPDRIIRIILGLGLLSLLFFLDGNAKYWGLVGLIPLITGLFGFCPIYYLFKISSKKKA
jgi:hypothetical protein